MECWSNLGQPYEYLDVRGLSFRLTEGMMRNYLLCKSKDYQNYKLCWWYDDTGYKVAVSKENAIEAPVFPPICIQKNNNSKLLFWASLSLNDGVLYSSYMYMHTMFIGDCLWVSHNPPVLFHANSTSFIFRECDWKVDEKLENSRGWQYEIQSCFDWGCWLVEFNRPWS